MMNFLDFLGTWSFKIFRKENNKWMMHEYNFWSNMLPYVACSQEGLYIEPKIFFIWIRIDEIILVQELLSCLLNWVLEQFLLELSLGSYSLQSFVFQ